MAEIPEQESEWAEYIAHRLKIVSDRITATGDRAVHRSNAKRWELLWLLYRDFLSECRLDPVRTQREFDRLMFESRHVSLALTHYFRPKKQPPAFAEVNEFLGQFRRSSSYGSLRHKHWRKYGSRGPIDECEFASERRRLHEFWNLQAQFRSFQDQKVHDRVAQVLRFQSVLWSNSFKVAAYRCWREALTLKGIDDSTSWINGNFSYKEVKRLIDRTRSYEIARKRALREVVRIVFGASPTVASEREVRPLVRSLRALRPRRGSGIEESFGRILHDGDPNIRASLLGRLVGLGMFREPRPSGDFRDPETGGAHSMDALAAEEILELPFESMAAGARRIYEQMKYGVRFHERAYPGLEVWLRDNRPVFREFELGWEEIFESVRVRFPVHPKNVDALRKWVSGRHIQLDLARGPRRSPAQELTKKREMGLLLLAPAPVFSGIRRRSKS